MSRYRWWICLLLMVGTTINYMDRQVIGLLKPVLVRDLGWTQVNYANTIISFQAAYALGNGLGGRLMDRVGVRLGYALAAVGWSIAAMLHGVARSVAGFSAMRAGLGLAEGGNFPAAVKAVAEWFPREERAVATGVLNAGSNIAVVITPLMVPWLVLHWGWPAAFYVTGGLGLVWVVPWLICYGSPATHPRVNAAERARIGIEPREPAIPWLRLLRYRQTWSYVLGAAMTAPAWWFYLFWIPGFLYEKYGLSLLEFGPPLVTMYLIADVGSVAGGWLSSSLIRRRWSVNWARKTAMLTCALFAVPVSAAASGIGLWPATFLIGFAAAAHQGFSANLYTLVSDVAPRQSVASIVGIGGMAAAAVGVLTAKMIGSTLEATGSYEVLFGCASLAYLSALLVIHLKNPSLKPMPYPEESALS